MSGRRKSETGPRPAQTTAPGEPVRVPAGVFKNTCLALIDKVRDGRNEIVITKRGEPVARLVPVEAPAPSAFGYLRRSVLAADDIVAPDHDAWGALG